MIRESKFFISKGLYAVDLDGLGVLTVKDRVTIHRLTVPAVWFRRRRGVTVACIGNLWDYVRDPKPVTTLDALARMTDGRYGGAWIARWDGESYVSEHPQPPEAMQRHMSILRPMLDNFPAISAGYDGWWRYETACELRPSFRRHGQLDPERER